MLEILLLLAVVVDVNEVKKERVKLFLIKSPSLHFSSNFSFDRSEERRVGKEC